MVFANSGEPLRRPFRFHLGTAGAGAGDPFGGDVDRPVGVRGFEPLKGLNADSGAYGVGGDRATGVGFLCEAVGDVGGYGDVNAPDLLVHAVRLLPSDAMGWEP